MIGHHCASQLKLFQVSIVLMNIDHRLPQVMEGNSLIVPQDPSEKTDLHITHRVPPEVWEVVFQKLQPSYSYCEPLHRPASHYKWLSVLLVCHFFRDVALGCSTLWTCIHMGPETLGIARRFLKRSGAHKLLLVVSGFDDSSWPDAPRDLMISAAQRVATLVVVDSKIGTINDIGSFPILTTLIHRSTLNDTAFTKLECPNLHFASFQPPLLKMINHLPNLTSLFIGSSVTDRSIRLAPAKIIALLHAHPLLEELIFVRAFIDEEPDPSEITPHSLHKLKRLAFHRCESAAVRTIVSLIKHTHGLAILIDRISGWPKYIPSVKINRLITKSVPEGRSGYTDAFVSAFKRRSTRIGLSGPGVAYSIALPAEHGTDTADGVLSAMARSGHLARLERLWVLGLGYTTQSWLRSASNLSLLTIQCTRAMWYNSVWIQRLFQWLPSSLQELHILIYPSEDDANVTTNCETLLTLNDKRTKSLRIRLKVYEDPSRRDQIISIYEHCKDNEHVFVETWTLAQMRRDLTEEHLRSQCDLLPQHHKYWPSWFEDTLGYCLVQNGVDDNMWFPY